jgi:hypothetical protein
VQENAVRLVTIAAMPVTFFPAQFHDGANCR